MEHLGLNFHSTNKLCLVLGLLIFLGSIPDCISMIPIQDCSGTHVSFTGESNSTESTIEIPGALLFFSLTADITQSIPTDVVLVKLVTRDRDSGIVPCLDGVSGSCVFDMCNFLEINPELVTPPLTSCPISPGSYTFQFETVFNELWLPINGNMENVTYTTRYELQLNEQEVIGCFEYQFSLSTASQEKTKLSEEDNE